MNTTLSYEANSLAIAARRSIQPATDSLHSSTGRREQSVAPSKSAARCTSWGSTCAQASTPARSRDPREQTPRGIAVHIGARVAARALAGEVLVTSTTHDLVAGSGIEFSDRGDHQLKGVPELWRLYNAIR